MTVGKRFMVMGICVLMAMAITIGTASVTSRKDLEKQIDQAGMAALDDTAVMVDRMLEQLMVKSSAMSAQIGYLLDRSFFKDDGDLSRYVLDMGKNNRREGISNLFMGRASNGAFFTSNQEETLPEGFDPRTRPWYKGAMTAGGAFVTSPYMDAGTGRPIITVSIPIGPADSPWGVFGVDILLEDLRRFASGRKIQDAGNLFLMDGGGRIIEGPAGTVLGIAMKDDGTLDGSLRKAAASAMAGERGVATASMEGRVFRAFYGKSASGFPMVFLYPEERISSIVMALIVRLAGIGLAGIIAAGAVMALTYRAIASPLGRASRIAQRVAGGDLTVDRNDFMYDAKDPIGSLADSLAQMAEDLRMAMGTVKEECERSSERSAELTMAAERMSGGARRILASVDGVGRGSRENADSIQEASAALEEIASSAQTGADGASRGAERATTISERALEESSRLGDVISMIGKEIRLTETGRDAMKKLGETVTQVAHFVDTINGIADQTNLLALNAAIEAARAGNAGRGFAVVADEVRKLAEESGKASQKISDLIGDLQRGTESCEDSAERISAFLGDVAEKAGKSSEALMDLTEKIRDMAEESRNMAAISQEQAASGEEIAASVESIASANRITVNAIEDIRREADESARSAMEMAGRAETMAESAKKLDSLVSRFRLEGAKSPIPIGAPAKAGKALPFAASLS